jgi:predicted Zn-dependent protease
MGIQLWERMSKQEGKSSPPQFLSTHPALETRIADIKKYIPEAMPFYKLP